MNLILVTKYNKSTEVEAAYSSVNFIAFARYFSLLFFSGLATFGPFDLFIHRSVQYKQKQNSQKI